MPGRHTHFLSTGQPLPRERRPWRAALVLALIVAGAVTGIVIAWGRTSGGSAPCPAPRQLRVAAAPEIAPVLSTLAATPPAGGCRAITVTVRAEDPAVVAAGLNDSVHRPDVWVPDSSLWPALAASATGAAQSVTAAPVVTTASSTADYPSLARSPIVVAVAADVAKALGVHPSLTALAVLATRSDPVLFDVKGTSKSMPKTLTVVGLQAALERTPDPRAAMTALLRNAWDGPNALSADVAGPDQNALDTGSRVALATSEQAVWAHNNAGLRPMLTAVYPAPGTALDYPLVTLTTDPKLRAAVAALQGTWTSDWARATLRAHGFRSASGAGGTELAAVPGVQAAAVVSSALPSQQQVRAAESAEAVLAKPTRMLAIIDVSGSMATPVPGAHGASRLDLARAAAIGALGILPADSAVGLWEFASDLTAKTDYRELAPLAILDPVSRTRLATAVGQLNPIPDGGTGLYDSVLAGVRSVRASYDPRRVNSVVILSDGKDENDANHGISLASLRAKLRAEADPARPVPVIAIAYGPSSDAKAMGAISAMTGGALYVAKDPTSLPNIFLDAVGRRLCRPNCSGR
jgi:Ca-activated chloride channel family protein